MRKALDVLLIPNRLPYYYYCYIGFLLLQTRHVIGTAGKIKKFVFFFFTNCKLTTSIITLDPLPTLFIFCNQYSCSLFIDIYIVVLFIFLTVSEQYLYIFSLKLFKQTNKQQKHYCMLYNNKTKQKT